MAKTYILSIDQGTSGTKALIFDTMGNLVSKASEPLKSYYPLPGFVEQDPHELYQNVLTAVGKCYSVFMESFSGEEQNIISCGISNQRETFVVWDNNGEPLHNAVVWQCKRSVAICEELKQHGLEKLVNVKTGLTIDPYFSATKMMWLRQNNSVIDKAIRQGNAYFGTIDTWLLYLLTNKEKYYTDHTNASRTLFFNSYDLKWDEELLDEFGLTGLKLPEVMHSSAFFGESDFGGILPNKIPITGMIGDSQAAFFGEECFTEGMAKATLGTGSSILWNTGQVAQQNKNGILTTIGWSAQKNINYALEGVIVSCGATLEWLKNQLGLFSDNEEIEPMATSVTGNEGVYLIPAFSGLGAPHWKKEWKASIHGISFGTSKAHIVRAALESIAFQIKDVVGAIESETKKKLKELKVDGGITSNHFLMQFLADILQTPVTNIGISDVSARGAALISGLGVGFWQSIEDLPKPVYKGLVTYLPGKLSDDLRDSYTTWQELIAEKKR
ncbi:FGGY family carbohydrate kinase [Arenibacter troitsensis]|uniref:ATP:glycerol 3-phosphotransferase n=1 Tax=Arenibacter troitsensis TaxID=188872 RepID=A0A1X7IHX6_9FLAO|nr:glycerol kinase GlpK [Arenibacter troitsensis]SMG14471.1 glycerol kinase [Arenibacter troitsensis]